MYEHLKKLRESLGLTQADFGESVGVAKSTYNNYETGIREPKSDFWIAVAQKYGVTIDYLMGFSDDPKMTSEIKTAPPEFSDEARKIARSYDRLTEHGKGAVRAILGYEEAFLSKDEPQEDPPSSNLAHLPTARRSGPMVQIKVYDQPAAAGLGNYLDEPESHMEQYPTKVIPSKTDFGVIISGDSMEPKVHNGGTVFVRAMPAIDPGQIGIFVLDGKAYCKKLSVDHQKREIRLVSLNPKYDDIIVREDYDDFRTLGRVLGQWTPGFQQDLFGW